mmetsp:Transcript_70426/g.161597  ORF Transcript_70426/g.161597 Transcript_70426/m.161597 type:complete len:519 (-) Transcript_70426:114-1670(-)
MPTEGSWAEQVPGSVSTISAMGGKQCENNCCSRIQHLENLLAEHIQATERTFDNLEKQTNQGFEALTEAIQQIRRLTESAGKRDASDWEAAVIPLPPNGFPEGVGNNHNDHGGDQGSEKENDVLVAPNGTATAWQEIDKAEADFLDQFSVQRNKTFMHQLWLLLEEPSSSIAARLIMILITLAIFMSVAVTVLESTHYKQQWGKGFFDDSEKVFNIIFTVEIVLRFFVSKRRSDFFLTQRRQITQENFYNIVDLLSVVPFYISLVSKDVGEFAAFKFVSTLRPTLRLLKVSRNFDGFALLVRSLEIAIPQLPVPLFLFFLLTLGLGSLMWFVEDQLNNNGSDTPSYDGDFGTIPQCMWFTVVTISTVGYGDVSPKTEFGKVLASVAIVVGLLYMAMPLAVVGSAFTYVWDKRTEIFVIQKAKRRLATMAIDGKMLKHAFDHVDKDKSGTLDKEEFQAVVNDLLGLSLSPGNISDLFEFFDDDESGTITFEEFGQQFFDPTELAAAFKTNESALGKSIR